MKQQKWIGIAAVAVLALALIVGASIWLFGKAQGWEIVVVVGSLVAACFTVKWMHDSLGGVGYGLFRYLGFVGAAIMIAFGVIILVSDPIVVSGREGTDPETIKVLQMLASPIAPFALIFFGLLLGVATELGSQIRNASKILTEQVDLLRELKGEIRKKD